MIEIEKKLKNSKYVKKLGERDKATQAEEKIDQAFNYIDSNR